MCGLPRQNRYKYTVVKKNRTTTLLKIPINNPQNLSLTCPAVLMPVTKFHIKSHNLSFFCFFFSVNISFCHLINPLFSFIHNFKKKEGKNTSLVYHLKSKHDYLLVLGLPTNLQITFTHPTQPIKF